MISASRRGRIVHANNAIGEKSGLVLVMGDISLVGGGASIHTYGSTLVGQSLTAIDPESELTVAGNADLFYSSEVLMKIQDLLAARYSLVYYDEK